MAFELHRTAFPGIAASNLVPRTVVKLADGSQDRAVCGATNNTEMPLGISLASGLRGEAVTVHDRGNVVKVVAAASLGVGADVNLAAAGTHSLAPVAGASGAARWSVGQAVSSAAAGEVFSLYVNPRQLSNLA